MISIHTFFEFTTVVIILALIPGPDILFVISQGVTKGAKAAIALTCGLTSGVIVHTTAAAFGVSVVFQTSQTAFTILKIAGALYLFYLAYKTFTCRNDNITTNSDKNIANLNFKQLIVRGFFMNTLNPKVALFFLALFPQYVDESRGKVVFQMLQLGAIFMFCTFIVFSIVGISAHKIFKKIMQKPKISKAANILTSFIFVAIGIRLFLTQK